MGIMYLHSLQRIPQMKLLFFVGLGGACGATMRFGLSILLNRKEGFPYGTLCANAIGCLILGFLSVYLTTKADPIWKPFLTTGLLGALTTFSTFSFETLQYILRAQWKLAILYLILQLILGLSLCLAGIKLAQIVTNS